MGYLIRKTVNQFFGVEEDPNINEKTQLLLSSKWMDQAKTAVDALRSLSDVDPICTFWSQTQGAYGTEWLVTIGSEQIGCMGLPNN